MRRKLIEADLIECILGLGPNLFYNSPMEACVVICRSSKSKAHKGRILFINAIAEVTRERAQSFLTDDHIQRIVAVYRAFKDEPGFTRVAGLEEIRAKNGNLSIPLYVPLSAGLSTAGETSSVSDVAAALTVWLKSSAQVRASVENICGTGASASFDMPRVNLDWTSLPLFRRNNWTRVRFGDVVDNLNEREEDPAGAGLERFIGLEHLEPGSLHIHAWGNVADGTTFTRRCRPGQVLFGKRRAYQRKVAVAEFDAVVSGDIYVLAPKKNHLLPELLSFLCLSERFFRHAVGTSAGSLSPRTNWTDLARFEFDLPPLDQQQCIAEILWGVDNTLAAWKATLKQHAETLFAFASSATLRGLRNESTQRTAIGEIPASWRILRIEEVTEHSAYGPRFPGSSYSPDGNAWQIRTTDFDRAGGINFSQIPSAKLDEDTILLHRLKTGDFLLSRSGEYAGLTAVFSEPDDNRSYIPGAFLIRYRLSEALDPEYLLTLCNAAFGEKFVKPLATGSAQPNISGSAFSGLLVPVPPVNEQREIVRKVAEFQRAGAKLTEHVKRTQQVLSALVNTFN